MIESVVFFVLTPCLLITQPTPVDALKYTGIAYYKQSGLEKELEPEFNALEKKYLPVYIKDTTLVMTLGYDILVNNQIHYGWSF